jgi:hypothetical protein
VRGSRVALDDGHGRLPRKPLRNFAVKLRGQFYGINPLEVVERGCDTIAMKRSGFQKHREWKRATQPLDEPDIQRIENRAP